LKSVHVNLAAAVAAQERICHLAVFLLSWFATVSFNCSAKNFHV